MCPPLRQVTFTNQLDLTLVPSSDSPLHHYGDGHIRIRPTVPFPGPGEAGGSCTWRGATEGAPEPVDPLPWNPAHQPSGFRTESA